MAQTRREQALTDARMRAMEKQLALDEEIQKRRMKEEEAQGQATRQKMSADTAMARDDQYLLRRAADNALFQEGSRLQDIGTMRSKGVLSDIDAFATKYGPTGMEGLNNIEKRNEQERLIEEGIRRESSLRSATLADKLKDQKAQTFWNLFNVSKGMSTGGDFPRYGKAGAGSDIEGILSGTGTSGGMPSFMKGASEKPMSIDDILAETNKIMSGLSDKKVGALRLKNQPHTSTPTDIGGNLANTAPVNDQNNINGYKKRPIKIGGADKTGDLSRNSYQYSIATNKAERDRSSRVRGYYVDNPVSKIYSNQYPLRPIRAASNGVTVSKEDFLYPIPKRSF